MWLARVRSFIARHRAIYWGVIAGLTLTISLVLVAQSRQVVQARQAWGTSIVVWVAAADTSPGTTMVVERRVVPAAMVPLHAVPGESAVNGVARQQVSRGEIVVTADVGNGRFPLLPDGSRGVAIPADDTTIPVAVADHVDIVAGGAVLVENGVVVDVQPGAVTVGVVADAAPAVAAAALDRSAVLVARPD